MKITKPPRYVDGIMVNERIVVEALNKYFFDTKAAKGPYPALYCDQCNHLDHWQPKGTEWKDSTRYVQIWNCLC